MYTEVQAGEDTTGCGGLVCVHSSIPKELSAADLRTSKSGSVTGLFLANV